MRADLAYTSKRLLMFVSTCSRRSMRPSEQTAGVVAQLYPGWSTYCTCIATRNLLPATIGGNDTAAAGERPHGKRSKCLALRHRRNYAIACTSTHAGCAPCVAPCSTSD
mmetsp:Transcript_15974/g.47379  ORF Transcript_15974/g.47379 Transcript_15974/m.47379 type:complete len:109 (-) Transcript_15974:1515-1841(-)